MNYTQTYDILGWKYDMSEKKIRRAILRFIKNNNLLSDADGGILFRIQDDNMIQKLTALNFLFNENTFAKSYKMPNEDDKNNNEENLAELWGGDTNDKNNLLLPKIIINNDKKYRKIDKMLPVILGANVGFLVAYIVSDKTGYLTMAVLSAIICLIERERGRKIANQNINLMALQSGVANLGDVLSLIKKSR
ncbi:MAG: hypothetical protein LBL75_04180 [Rickettsiales bacterium]|jgi:hypothetical protein|nr:hypothetical protein [Rickettsiales bacterium]